MRRVLEIGSGTGQHAVQFARALPHLSWQPSDLDVHHPGIRAWVEYAQLDNLRAPISLDVRSAALQPASIDGVFSANTAHIMAIDAVAAMFALVASALARGGRFCLYGPFRQYGQFNTSSNAAFDATLRARDGSMGIRDLEQLDDFGSAAGLHRVRLYAMPANNHLAVWERTA